MDLRILGVSGELLHSIHGLYQEFRMVALPQKERSELSQCIRLSQIQASMTSMR